MAGPASMMSPATETASTGTDRHSGHHDPQPETRPVTPADNNAVDTSITADNTSDTSCLGCRKRKLKCSRDLPRCSHCQRLDVACAYDAKKAKPGLRPGAIEALSQRIEALESALEDALSRQATPATATPAPEAINASNANVVGILAVLAQELQKLNSNAVNGVNGNAAAVTTAGTAPPPYQPIPAPAPVNGNNIVSNSTAMAQPSPIPPSPSLSSTPLASTHSQSLDHHRRKRRRMVDSCGNPDIDIDVDLVELATSPGLPSSPSLPPPATLQAVVNAYFIAVQPWIPVLHETQFRRRMHDAVHDAEQRPRLACLLHAMVVAAARYVDDDGVDTDSLLRLAQRSRSHVLLAAMDSLSVESLQALIILAFDDIGSGNTARAWSIVASLTRTIDFLGINVEGDVDNSGDGGGGSGSDDKVENEDDDKETLMRPVTILGPPRNWIEEEERRRVFWCVLLLDRFCSVTTGWATGLAASDVHRRRLPADGFFFHKEEPVLTPYMTEPGASPREVVLHVNGKPREPRDHARDRDAREPVESPASTHSPAYPGGLPAHHHAHHHTNTENAGHSTNVGAFAYCIEAAESLSRVVSTFLRQHVDLADRQDVSRWLMRFKELDLRLVHWKMYLPQRWRDSNVSRQPAFVRMDPNLTLAHITHNTSTILLHQRIAYPYPDPARWTRIVKLPSYCSAETCQNAAVETAAITSKYLRYTAKHGPVASQFAFCVYISARVLLVHWRAGAEEEVNRDNRDKQKEGGDVDVLPEFWSLLRSLEDMDRRWMGSNNKGTTPSLAGHYAQQLKDLHRQCLASPSFVVDVLGYTEDDKKRRRDERVTPETRTSVEAVGQNGQNGQGQAVVQADDVQMVPVPESIQTAPQHPASHPVHLQPPPPPQHQPQPSHLAQLAQVAQVHSTWPMQSIQPDQLSPVMAATATAYQQTAHGNAMADNPAYAAAASIVSMPHAGHAGHTDDLAAISHLLLDQQFMDRDRVISFEDSFFAAPGRWT
ncbi:hypothetical protein SBRCBS47491_005941 [Sporothrix bragantina]|uniref:Zn(2)-C6 fungal-type domain-containing protein n=1 Tax=Sporothrix bragantina TaxID=671064 RepID=A0ABP0C139_9PEZI